MASPRGNNSVGGLPTNKRKRVGEISVDQKKTGSLFYDKEKQHQFDRILNVEAPYSTERKPASCLLTVSNANRADGTQYNFRQNVGAIINGGGLGLKEIAVSHRWNTIHLNNQTIQYEFNSVIYSHQIPVGYYTVASLVVVVDAFLAADTAADVVCTAGTDASGADVFVITLVGGAAGDFEFVRSDFIYHGPFVHGLSVYKNRGEEGQGSAEGWYPPPKMFTGGAPVVYSGCEALMLASLYYVITSANLSKSHKMHAYGSKSGTLGAFIVTPATNLTLERIVLNTQEIELRLDTNNNVGDNVDIVVIDQFGNVASSFDPCAVFTLMFSVSLRY